MIYLLVLIFLFFLSFRYDICGKEKGRDWCYLVVLLIFILIAGLRYRIGTDTTGYLSNFYHRYPSLGDFSFEEYPVGRDPFYVLMNSLVISLGGRFYIVQLIHATFVNGLIFKYIRRHSPFIFTCVLFYSIMQYFYFNTQIMRGSMSIVICLYANDYFLNRKWLKGYLLLVISLMFHAQTIVLFFMPLLFFLRLNRKGIIVLLAAVVIGQVAGILLNDYAELLMTDDNTYIGDKALAYANSDEYSVEMSIKWIILDLGSRFIFILLILWYLKRYDSGNSLLRFEPLFLLFCFFLLINAGFRIAYRYVAYYSIYAAILYAYGFVTLARSVKLSPALSYARAFVLFFPLMWLVCRTIILNKENHVKYFPYSSVIEKSTDRDRENLYRLLGRPPARSNEY